MVPFRRRDAMGLIAGQLVIHPFLAGLIDGVLLVGPRRNEILLGIRPLTLALVDAPDIVIRAGADGGSIGPAGQGNGLAVGPNGFADLVIFLKSQTKTLALLIRDSASMEAFSRSV